MEAGESFRRKDCWTIRKTLIFGVGFDIPLQVLEGYERLPSGFAVFLLLVWYCMPSTKAVQLAYRKVHTNAFRYMI